MFSVGSLVLIKKIDSNHPIAGMPPGIIIKSYLGKPNDAMVHNQDRIVYDLLFMNRIEIAVDHEWLILLNDSYGI
ncbi:hypothetical protein CMI47_11410 [Candidatus Pacearchaeota archaeon]|nr:hypothetical protein [Candidatus Pacearchaeota archaeon]|tara:strand:+ start:172 stop:396 length:225 start_codon:yes stop_codon:yes gene_type:complete